MVSNYYYRMLCICISDIICDIANRFSEQLFTSSFYPIITKPTRITEHTATLMDNIFTNNIDKIDSSVNGIIFYDISDHLPILHVCDLNATI